MSLTETFYAFYSIRETGAGGRRYGAMSAASSASIQATYTLW